MMMNSLSRQPIISWARFPKIRDILKIILKTYDINIVDSLTQQLRSGYTKVIKVGLLLAHGSGYGRMPFLPLPDTYMWVPAKKNRKN